MRKSLFSLVTFAACISSIAADGTLIFKTLGIQKADGSGTYNVPLYMSPDDPASGGSANRGAGLLQGGVTVGLFTSGSSTPFATALLGTTAAQSPFVVNPASQTVAVPGAPPGSTPSIFIRAWQGASFEAASAQYSFLESGEWILPATKPLGGDPGGGSLPITPPTLTGFGPESGAGLQLFYFIPEPSTISVAVLGLGILVLQRRK